MASRTSKLYEGIPWPIRHSLKAIGSDGSTWFWLTRRTQSSSGIVPRGVLFRDEEREMRERIIAADLIEVVIGLGPNLFYNSPMEACIVVCRSQKRPEQVGQVLFIEIGRASCRERV